MPSGCVLRYDGPRGVSWKLKYRDADGRQVKETLGHEPEWNRKLAERELIRRLDAVDRGYRKPAILTFGEYADRWLEEAGTRRQWKPATVLVFKNAVRRLKPTFETMPLASIRPRDVVAYARDALEEFSAKSVQLHLNVLHDVMKTAVAEEIIQSNPVSGIERPRAVRRRWRILTPREVPRVSKAFSDDRARRVFLTLALTGIRRMELLGLRWRHVNLVEGTLRIEESKSDEGERSIALPRTLVDELADHFASSSYRSDDDYVFAHPQKGSKLDAKWYHEVFQAALVAAGVGGHVRTFHDMRHTAITNLAATGASPIAVMATAGHRSMSTTKGYMHLAGVVFRDEANALERRLLGEVVPNSGTETLETALLSQDG